jgi:hypothetical protein
MKDQPNNLAQQLGHVSVATTAAYAATPAPLTPETVSAILRDPDSPLYPSRITVFCDDCGVQNTGEYMVSTEQTSTERLEVARAHLRTQGWQCDETGDFCPEHKGAASAPDEPTACAKCRTAFDPTDTRFDGHAQHGVTPYCRRCVDLCHDNEIADHRCVICA